MTRLGRILARGDLETVNLVAALTAITWGLWVMNPSISSYSGPSFAALALLMPEWALGLLVASIGVVKLVALLTNPHPLVARIVSLASIFIWVFLLVMTGIGSNWTSIRLQNFVLYALTECWVQARCK